MCNDHAPTGSADRPAPRLSRRVLLTAAAAAAAAAITAPAAAATARAAAAPGGVAIGPSQYLTQNRSGNGWPVPATNSPGDIGVLTYTVPGTDARLAVKSGPVATILLHVARRVQETVEPLQRSQCGAFSWRPNVNSPSQWSNHASGTAIDLNWLRHPNGARNTFSAAQVVAVRNILSECRGVVRWGGDYTSVADEMHWEINVPVLDARLTALAGQLPRATGAGPFALGDPVLLGGPGTADGVHPS